MASAISDRPTFTGKTRCSRQNSAPPAASSQAEGMALRERSMPGHSWARAMPRTSAGSSASRSSSAADAMSPWRAAFEARLASSAERTPACTSTRERFAIGAMLSDRMAWREIAMAPPPRSILRLHLAGHELDHRLPWRLGLVQHAVDHLADGHLDGELAGEVAGALRVQHPLRHLPQRLLDLGELLAAPELEADRVVARLLGGAGEDEVAQPGEPGERHRIRALAHGEPPDLGQAARDEGRPGVRAEA